MLELGNQDIASPYNSKVRNNEDKLTSSEIEPAKKGIEITGIGNGDILTGNFAAGGSPSGVAKLFEVRDSDSIYISLDNFKKIPDGKIFLIFECDYLTEDGELVPGFTHVDLIKHEDKLTLILNNNNNKECATKNIGIQYDTNNIGRITYDYKTRKK